MGVGAGSFVNSMRPGNAEFWLDEVTRRIYVIARKGVIIEKGDEVFVDYAYRP